MKFKTKLSLALPALPPITKIYIMAIAIAALAVFSTAARLYAEAPPLSEESEITDIVVHASPLLNKASLYAGSASVINPDYAINPSFLTISDIAESTANFTATGGSASARFFQIRGIGELEQYEGAPNPSVGLIFDDLDLSGLGIPATLFDIEQIEVLRGPQATLFGANALAGAVALRSAEPTRYDSVRAQLGFGNDNFVDSGLAFGGSVMKSEDLSFRLSVSNTQSDGFRHNLFLDEQDTNSRQNSDSRFQLRYQPQSRSKVDIEGIFARQNSGYDAFALNNAFTTQSDNPGEDDHDLAGGKLSVEHVFASDIKLQSISSASNSDLDYGFDGDWGNNSFWGEYAPYDFRSSSARERKVFSQEFRLSTAEDTGNSWITGIFAQNLSEDTQIRELQDEITYDQLDSSYEADSYAAFAASESKLSETWTFGTNIRVEYRKTEYSDSNDSYFNPDYNMQGGSAYLRHELSEDQQLYALASRGFKGGGFNAGTRIPADYAQYSPETLWNYEIGSKGYLQSPSLSYDISTFWMQRYDQQLKLAIQDNPSDPLSFNYLTDNAASGRNIGMEGNLRSQLMESLLLQFSAGLLYTKITSTDPALSYLEDREQSVAPPWNYSLMARYAISENWYLRASISGQDSYYFDDSHDQKSDVYNLLDTEIGWANNNLKIALWGKNLTNENYALRGFYFGNEPPDFPNKLYIQRGDPTSFGLNVTYLF